MRGQAVATEWGSGGALTEASNFSDFERFEFVADIKIVTGKGGAKWFGGTDCAGSGCSAGHSIIHRWLTCGSICVLVADGPFLDIVIP